MFLLQKFHMLRIVNKDCTYCYNQDQCNIFECSWIVDSECSHHMTRDMAELLENEEYKGNHVVVTATTQGYLSLILERQWRWFRTSVLIKSNSNMSITYPGWKKIYCQYLNWHPRVNMWCLTQMILSFMETLNHQRRRDMEELSENKEYKGNQAMANANNSRLPITIIGETMRISSNQVQLQNVYHIPWMKKNLLSVSQLTSSGNYVVFSPKDVKVYRNLKPSSTPVIDG